MKRLFWACALLPVQACTRQDPPLSPASRFITVTTGDEIKNDNEFFHVKRRLDENRLYAVFTTSSENINTAHECGNLEAEISTFESVPTLKRQLQDARMNCP